MHLESSFSLESLYHPTQIRARTMRLGLDDTYSFKAQTGKSKIKRNMSFKTSESRDLTGVCGAGQIIFDGCGYKSRLPVLFD